MDFLQILTIYVFGFVTCVGLYFFRDIPLLKYGPLGYIRHVCWKTYMHVVPQSLLDLTYNVIHTALYTRNQAFRLIFGSILFLGHVVFVIDMLPILYRFRPDENHVLFPIVNLLATLYVYHRSCVDDPGEITPVTLHKYSNVYSYDNRLYSPRNMCRTCQFYKPARSKHCSICDRCVHRFDHHCIWTNSDIGGLNHRFFVLFLWSLLCIQFDGVIVGTRCLWLHSTHYKLMDASVMMSSGEVMPVTKFIVFQHLFMHFPRLVFLIVSLGLIIPMVGSFCVYHTYLILFNQTTNERYKEAEVQAAHKHSCSTIDKPNKGRQFKLHKNEADNSHSLSYNNGFIQNIKEVFCVHTFLQHKRKLR